MMTVNTASLFCLFPLLVPLVTAKMFNEHIVSTKSLNWTMAATGCDDEFSQVILEITNEHDFELVKESNISLYDGTFWMGLRFIKERNIFIWQDGRVSNWSNWAEGYPTFLGDKPCVAISTATLQWSNHNCSEKLHYVCHDAPVIPVIIPEVITPTETSVITLVLIYSSVVLLVTLTYILISYMCLRQIKEKRFAIPTKPTKIQHWPS